MKIKKFKHFLESISGTELIGSLGPGIGSQKLPNTITQQDTEVIASDITGELYTYDDYNQLYEDYLKKGKKPLVGGFSKQNLEIILRNNITTDS
jgi:hypothetical protein